MTVEDQNNILNDKVRQASGAVHRPSEAEAEASSFSNALPVMAAEEQSGADVPSQPAKPPPYSAPSNGSLDPRNRAATVKGPQYYPGLPVLDYRQYSPPMFDFSSDTTTITSKATYLSENARALSTLIRNLATVPPKPQIHVTGNRGRRVDFSVKMNLMNLLIPDKASDRTDYLRTINRDEVGFRGGTQPALQPHINDGGLDEWCKMFVEDSSSAKSFLLERVVANLDTNWLEGQLRSLVATTDYKGIVTVSFPVTHSRVVIQSPDKINKFFTSMSTLFSGKNKYDVVKAVWPFATAKNGAPNRKCTVQTEKTWWEEWKDPIKHAVSTGRQGWVTNEDKLECIMESKGKGLGVIDWGPDY